MGSVAQVVFDGKALASNVAVSLEGKDVHQHTGVQVSEPLAGLRRRSHRHGQHLAPHIQALIGRPYLSGHAD